MCRYLCILGLLAGLTGGQVSADLVGYWALDGNATDSSGHGNNGTISGNVSASADRNGTPGGAMAFGGGGSDKIDVGNGPDFQITGAMTLMAWVRLESGSSTNGRIISKMGQTRAWSLNIENSWNGVPKPGALYIAPNGTSVKGAVDDASLPTDQWVHLAGVYTPGVSMKVYVNGDLAYSDAVAIPASQFSSNGLPVLIGNRSECGSCGWLGALDEVRIYNEALSEAAIEAIMNQGTVPPTAAGDPQPADGATDVSLNANLSWAAGNGAPAHDVYFGTVSPGTFRGRQVEVAFEPGPLEVNTTYYWRIDEQNAQGTATGPVWSFRTGSGGSTNATRIMPLGDSITQGSTNFDNYRHHLWAKLQAAGYGNIDFVGSHDVLANSTADPLVFDKDHEGHYGWHTDQIVSGGGIPAGGSGNLNQWLTGLQAAGKLPDVVLMHLGSNDVLHNPAGYDQSITIGEMKSVIDVLRSFNPKVTILLAKVIPHKKASSPSVDSLNALIPGLDSYETATSAVMIVDQHTGFSTSWLADDVHPNTVGAVAMSDRWFDALEPLLQVEKPRVIVSSDIGGYDPDDFQAMVHYLVHTDRFDTEGLVASPPGAGRKAHVLEAIEQYAIDYGNLHSHSPDFPAPQALRDVAKQGALDASPSAGYSSATEGSNWIISRANASDPRPLWILVWGSITDVAQAVHDAPSIKSKIRVYSIGSWNTLMDPNARSYLYNNHPDLWWIESDTTMRGMYVGGNQSGDLGNWTFVEQHVRHHGALGDYFYSKKPDIKMGDTPTHLYLLWGSPDLPTTEHWGGRFGATSHGPNYWADLTDPQYREGEYNGAKTVNVWRESYLRDWQTRMDWAGVNADVPPVIAEVSPDPGATSCTTEYTRQLALSQSGSPSSWSVVQGPAGTQVGADGLVSGWTPACSDIGTLFTFEIRATNNGGSDTETWGVKVQSVADYDGDDDVDQEDFGVFQSCMSGSGTQYSPGCARADLHGDGDVDPDDFQVFQSCMGGANAPPGC